MFFSMKTQQQKNQIAMISNLLFIDIQNPVLEILQLCSARTYMKNISIITGGPRPLVVVV